MYTFAEKCFCGTQHVTRATFRLGKASYWALQYLAFRIYLSVTLQWQLKLRHWFLEIC